MPFLQAGSITIMAAGKGRIVLMGSGELTATMVEVHKELLSGLGAAPRAVFLDTPAGFQLNADQISQKAADYFQSHIHQPLSIASFKAAENSTPLSAEQAFHTLREADFILIGPGSPTYAVRQWQQTPVPEILKKQVERGACLVAASAAALTVGRFTLPVYEIYKVGEALHWIDGIDILGHFGLSCVVIPHWNNAEGGTHDTRFCYMGEARLKALEARLPEEVAIVGLDEHTACVIDFEKREAMIKGIGRVIVRRGGIDISFRKGDVFSIEEIQSGSLGKKSTWPTERNPAAIQSADAVVDTFWDSIHELEAAFQEALEAGSWEGAAGTLLRLDDKIWEAAKQGEQEEFIAQAREILRDMIAVIGTRLGAAPSSSRAVLGPVVEELISLRAQFRDQKKWSEADALRDCLGKVRIVIEDTKTGSTWQLRP